MLPNGRSTCTCVTQPCGISHAFFCEASFDRWYVSSEQGVRMRRLDLRILKRGYSLAAGPPDLCARAGCVAESTFRTYTRMCLHHP